MPFTQTVYPQFRDADADGLIGLKGCLRYFQDIHTWFMHSVNKGNDVLPEQYGAAWVYTRYRMELCQRLDYTGPVELSCRMEPYRLPVLVTLQFEARQHALLAARGRLECCVFSLTRQRPLKLQAVDFPEGLAEAGEGGLPAFLNLGRETDGMEERYLHTVRVSDLDKSRHMNNLRYIEMFEDAFDSAFWAGFRPRGVEICFLSQCREGETLSVRAAQEEGGLRMAALHENGKLAAVALFTNAAGDPV